MAKYIKTIIFACLLAFSSNLSAQLEPVQWTFEVEKAFGIKLVKFSNRARFTQRVKVDSMAKVVKGSLTYMTCDDESCLPPENVKFSIALKN